jgi:hypothetical protein
VAAYYGPSPDCSGSSSPYLLGPILFVLRLTRDERARIAATLSATRCPQNSLSHAATPATSFQLGAENFETLDGVIAVVDSPADSIRPIGWISRFLVYGGGAHGYFADAYRIVLNGYRDETERCHSYDGRENFPAARY